MFYRNFGRVKRLLEAAAVSIFPRIALPRKEFTFSLYVTNRVRSSVGNCVLSRRRPTSEKSITRIEEGNCGKVNNTAKTVIITDDTWTLLLFRPFDPSSVSTFNLLSFVFTDDCPNCVDEHTTNLAASRWTMPLLKLGEKRYYLGIFFKVSFHCRSL